MGINIPVKRRSVRSAKRSYRKSSRKSRVSGRSLRRRLNRKSLRGGVKLKRNVGSETEILQMLQKPIYGQRKLAHKKLVDKKTPPYYCIRKSSMGVLEVGYLVGYDEYRYYIISSTEDEDDEDDDNDDDETPIMLVFVSEDGVRTGTNVRYYSNPALFEINYRSIANYIAVILIPSIPNLKVPKS